MKHVLVIYEGAADAARDELEGTTPLEIARNVNATALIKRGCGGLLAWPRDEKSARTENALALLLGINPAEARTLRRGPVEALGTGIDPSQWTYAYRGNFITTDGALISESRVSDLTIDETVWLTQSIAEAQTGTIAKLEVIGQGRVSVTFDRLKGKVDPGQFPEPGMDFDNESSGNDRLDFMASSAKVLAGQSINEVRVDLGENPASMLWLWGGGPPVSIGRPFLGAPLKAAMITNSPLARGMARLCGMQYIDLGDAWGENAKHPLIERDAVAACIHRHDLTVIYVESPEEAGRFGEVVDKVKGIDRLDIHVLKRINDAVATIPDARMMVTALPEDGEYMETTPVFLTGTRITQDSVERWDEIACADGSIGALPAHRCLSELVGE